MAVCSARLSPLFRGALLLPAWRMIILNDFDAIYAVASRGRVMDHNDRQSWRDAAKVKRSAVRRATRSPVNKFRLGWVDARCRESFPPGLSRMKLTRERSNRAGGSCRMLSSGSVQDTPRSAPSRPPSSPLVALFSVLADVALSLRDNFLPSFPRAATSRRRFKVKVLCTREFRAAVENFWSIACFTRLRLINARRMGKYSQVF